MLSHALHRISLLGAGAQAAGTARRDHARHNVGISANMSTGSATETLEAWGKIATEQVGNDTFCFCLLRQPASNKYDALYDVLHKSRVQPSGGARDGKYDPVFALLHQAAVEVGPSALHDPSLYLSALLSGACPAL